MTSPYLPGDIKRDEGCELKAYPDPISHGDPWTIGYGETGPDIKPGVVWTQQQADDALAYRIKSICQSLDTRLPWWRDLSDLRQDVLVNMAYNMGVSGLLGFRSALDIMKEGDYEQAAVEMLDSKWATQVPARASRLATQMKTGVHSV